MGNPAVPGWTPCPGRHSGQSWERCWDQKPHVPGARQPEQKGAEDLSQGPRVEAVALGLLRYLPQMPEQELQGERVLERDRRRLQGQQQLLPAILWLGDLWGENKTQGKSWDSRHHSPHSGCVTAQERCQQWGHVPGPIGTGLILIAQMCPAHPAAHSQGSQGRPLPCRMRRISPCTDTGTTGEGRSCR